LTSDGAEESKSCGKPDRGCGGREMDAMNAVLKRYKKKRKSQSKRSRWMSRPPDRLTSPATIVESLLNLEVFNYLE
jgi:hypothetical protein